MKTYPSLLASIPVPKGKRVLVCGGRDFQDRAFVWAVLEHIKPAFIVTGGQGKKRSNKGADLEAELFAKVNKVPFDVVHADWDAFGRSAGPRRNSEILLRYTDLDWAIGFPGGKGTEDMLKKARLAGLQVLPFVFDEEDPTSYRIRRDDEY
jgi:hypothetical protein